MYILHGSGHHTTPYYSYLMNLYTLAEKYLSRYLFHLLFIATLLPVWLYPHFLTTDGPCHVYNATILYKWLHGQGHFYQQFYTINAASFPNWFSHLILVGLLHICNPETADKLIICLSLMCFAYGFRYYISSFSARQYWLSLLVFPFLWQLSMLLGFYNYVFSIGLCFYMAGYLQTYYSSLTWRRMAYIMALGIVLFSMHLLGVLLLFAAFIALFLSKTATTKTYAPPVRASVALMPVLALSLNYLFPTGSDFVERIRSSYLHFFSISFIQSIAPADHWLSICLSVVIWSLVILALLNLNAINGNREWVAPAIMTLGCSVYYFAGPAASFGGSGILERVQILTYLFAIALAASIRLPYNISRCVIPTAAIIALSFIGFRLSCFSTVSTLVTELKTLSPLICNNSVVLPLTYIYAPKHNGQNVFRDVSLLGHCAETIDVTKNIVYLENYEANTRYFPLLWREHVNPFLHLSTGAGIEHLQPEAALMQYNQNHTIIDYIVTVGDKTPAANPTPSGSLSAMIDEKYECIYTTRIHHVRLYRYKK